MEATDFLNWLHEEINESTESPWATTVVDGEAEVFEANFTAQRIGNQLFITEEASGRSFCLTAEEVESGPGDDDHSIPRRAFFNAALVDDFLGYILWRFKRPSITQILLDHKDEER